MRRSSGDWAEDLRRARALHVGLVNAPAHAALQARGAGGLQERLGPVALQAQGLQHLGLALQGLVHGHDVVELAAAQLDGGGAELALVVLLLHPRIQALRLEEVLEGLGGGARQALAPVLQAQLLHPGLEDFGVLGVLRDDAVGGVPDAEAQGPPVAQGAHGDLGLVALGQQRGADAAQPALVCKLAKCDPDRICHGVDVVRCRKNACRSSAPWTPWSPPGTGTWRTSPTWSCTGTTGRPCSGSSPTAGAGTASPRPLETGQATWADFNWSLDATAHVEPRCLAQTLEVMEDAWPEGEEHMAKLSVNALIGLWARNQDLVYSTSNHELDGQGCQWRQTFTDAAGKVHWDHIYATELFSNYTLRPLHDYVMAQEHVAVAKIRDHLHKVPPRYVVALKTDCLVFQDLPKKFLPAVRELTARKHQDGTPVYRFEECKCLEGEYREPRIEAPYLTCYGPEWRSVEDPLLHCLNGKSLLLSGMPGTGKTHLARQIVAQSIRNGSCELDRLVIEEITQLDSSLWADIAELSLNPKVKFLLLGDFRQLPAVLDAFGGAPVTKPLRDSRLLHDLAGGCYHELTENHRSDEAIFGFLRYLRVDEAEEPPLREALQLARERFPRRGQPDTCLVISHANRMRLNEQHNRRLAPAEAVTLRYEGRAAAGTNAPQTMRVWPGLRLVGAGGKVAKGCFVAVTEAGPDAVRLDTGERFTHAELLRHTRLCHAITYASCQGLTLQGRVHLCDTSSPHFELRHLYVGASRATSAELLSVL